MPRLQMKILAMMIDLPYLIRIDIRVVLYIPDDGVGTPRAFP